MSDGYGLHHAGRSRVDETAASTWAHPAMQPTAMARLDRMTCGYFALDHAKQTARLLQTLPVEAKHSTQFSAWVHAELEPAAELHDATQLPGLQMRLMGFPWNGQAVYTIISDVADR